MLTFWRMNIPIYRLIKQVIRCFSELKAVPYYHVGAASKMLIFRYECLYEVESKNYFLHSSLSLFWPKKQGKAYSGYQADGRRIPKNIFP